MENNILSNLSSILRRIRQACINSNRNPDDVKLLLATKTVPADRIKIALDAGQTLIAENKVQELKEKYEALQNIPHTNHFIGHLQTNKIKDILKYDVSCIQSLDRLDLAEKLNQRLVLENKSIDVLIQVNTSDEESKFGVRPDKVIELIQQVAKLDNLKIKGLMTIGLFSAETEKIRLCFRLLKDLREEIAALAIPNVEMTELSMGMSGDLETAIEEGATIVRVGTAVFGHRIYPDSYYWNENKKSYPEVRKCT
jgi:pyridoxal phosphate enzyme (YggS family)